MEEYVLKGVPRATNGTRGARRLRRQGLLPANIYGHKQENVFVSLEQKEFERFFRQGHRMLTVKGEGLAEHAVVKEVQYDHMGTGIVHVDLARVDLNERISIKVSIVPLGQAKGQAAGGSLDFVHAEVTVEGTVRSLPEKIEVSVAALEIGQALRVKDLKIPEGCVFKHDPEEIICAVHEKRIPVVEAAAAPAGPVEMPELIAKKKETEEGEEPPKEEKKK